MPWRTVPRPAWAIGLPCALILGVAASSLRSPHRPLEPAAPTLRASAAPSINETLTPDDAGCAGVRSTEWHPLSGVEYTGRLRLTMPPASGASVVLFVGDSMPLDIEVDAGSGPAARVTRERMHSGPGVGVPPDFWLDDMAPWSAPQEITRLVIDAPNEQARTVKLWLGRRAPRVLARLMGYPPGVRARVCAWAVAPDEQYFATGWYAEEETSEGRVRWMRERGAVLVASHDGRAARVRVRAAPAAASGGGQEDGSTELNVRANDVVDLPAVTLRDGMHEYEWIVPDSAWVPGTNELLFSVSRTVARGTRRLGLALASLHVE